MKKSSSVVLLVGILVNGLTCLEAFGAGTFTAFGPTDYTRTTGTPATTTQSFSILDPQASYILHVYNGGKNGKLWRRVSSATIGLNGEDVVKSNEFNQNISHIEKRVFLSTANQLVVELRSEPGSGMTVEIIGIDATPPTIAATLSPSPNAAGWNNTNTTVHFDCADTTSGVASCPGDVLVQQDRANQVIAGTATDAAGNSASTNVTVNLDRTPPAIFKLVTPAPNAAGWNNTGVNVRFECSDATSGVASCSGPVQEDDEGANQLVSGTAIDLAGNTAVIDVSVNIDKTPPTIIKSLDPAPNAGGWHSSRVTVGFLCTDGLSGVAFCSPPAVVDSEGSGQTISGTAEDKAGNAASASALLNIDRTPPMVTAAVHPSPNEHGWHGSEAIVSFVCTDALSGLASCSDKVPVTTEGKNQVISGNAADKAGNTASAQIVLNIDRTPPEIKALASPSPNSAGWNSSNVAVTFACTDTISGMASCPAGILVAQDCLGQLISGTATDNAGNSASAGVTLNIDRTPPVVTMTSPPAGDDNLDSPAVVQGTTEALSGVAEMSCNGVPAALSGSSFTCSVPLEIGENWIQATATDRAGNTGAANRAVTYLGPKYLAIVDVMVFDQTDFSGVPEGYTGLNWGETCTDPYVPNVIGSRVWSDDVNKGIGGSYTTVWVKYDFVRSKSTRPVLVNYGNFHWPYWNVYCPAGWQPASGTSQGRQGALTTGTWGDCNRNGLCVQYLPMNQTDTFITNVGLSFTYNSESACPEMCEANGGYYVMRSDTYDIHSGCGDARWMYFCYGRGQAAPPMPDSISLTDEEKRVLLSTYAPRVWLAVGESYWPASVEWAFPHLERVLVNGQYWLRTREGLPEPSSVLDFFRGCNGYSTINPCSINDVPVYAFWVEKSNQSGGKLREYVDLVYFFYYPYNRGKEVVDTMFGNHVGDWEHLTVMLGWTFDNQTGWSLEPAQVYLPAHSFGSAYDWAEIAKIGGTHPVVYAAEGSHGLWLTSDNNGRHKYDEVWVDILFPIKIADLVDWTSEGTAWDTWNNVLAFDYNSQQGLGGFAWPLWMGSDFANPGGCGDPSNPACGPIYRWGNQSWGSVFGEYRLENGPTGPVSKNVWDPGRIK